MIQFCDIDINVCLFYVGLVEVEEGEVNGQELSIASHSVARISFAKKPHVEQVSMLICNLVDEYVLLLLAQTI